MAAAPAIDAAELPARHKAARDRVAKAVRSLGRLEVLGVEPVDLRYVLEVHAVILEVLTGVLLEQGFVSEEAFNLRDVIAIEGRAEMLEQRVQAALDGQREMPR